MQNVPALWTKTLPAMNTVIDQPDIFLMVLLSIGTFLWAYFRRPGPDDSSDEGGRPVPETPVPSPSAPEASGGGSGDGTDVGPLEPESPTPSEREPVSV